ncbi:MAG TPA: RNA methyltransferase [Acholeplasma sp.]|nr:RNA methyltransferase [Acholeplasma sp.]
MISSRDNAKIKWLFKLQTKKYRDQSNSFIIYGSHALEEAKKNGFITEIYTSNTSVDGTLISNELMKELSLTETPLDVLAICQKRENNFLSKRILMLDEIQDPGNLGTLIRSAVGFGFTTIIGSHKTADFYHEKTIRATQGNLFYASLIKAPLDERINQLKGLGYKIYGASSYGSTDLKDIEVSDKMVLILGNEGQGIKPELLQQTDQNVMIKTSNIESLNVGVAGSIIMYEWQVV